MYKSLKNTDVIIAKNSTFQMTKLVVKFALISIKTTKRFVKYML